MFGNVIHDTKVKKLPMESVDNFFKKYTEYEPTLMVESVIKGKVTKMMLESNRSYILDRIYDLVSTKISKLDPDYQEIYKSNGDITKYKHYKILNDSIEELKKISDYTDSINKKEYKSELEVAVFEAYANIKKYKTMWVEAFKYSNKLLQDMYFSIVGSIIHSVGYMASILIKYEARKQNNLQGQEVYDAIFDRENISHNSVPKTMVNLLVQFNMSIKDGSLEKYSKEYKKNPPMSEESTVLESFIAGLLTAGVIVTAIWMIPSVIRYSIYYFMHTKLKLSEYIQVQADFLEFNALKLQRKRGMDDKVAKRELEYVERLRRFAAKLSGDKYTTEKSVDKEIEEEDRKIAKEAKDAEQAGSTEPTKNDNRSSQPDDFVFI